jgi:glycosyltransferase involved in cell wall biosynthesis
LHPDASGTMKVLHIIPNLEIGGAEIFLLQLVRRLRQAGIESRILALSAGGPLKSEIEQQGTVVYELTPGSHLAIPVKLLQFLFALGKEWRPDIIQGWMYHANVASLLARTALPGRARVFWNIRMAHTQLNTEKKSTALSVKIGGVLSRAPDAIIYNSRNSAALHEEKLGFSRKNRHVIPNGFDTDEWTPSPDARVRVRHELGLLPDTTLIGMIARYHPFKNHSGFVESAAQIHRELPRVHFVLVGTNVDDRNAHLMMDIRNAGLVDSMHLLGPRRDVPTLTAALDLAVSPSHMEGFPNAVGEAMSCCVPCVVTNVGDSAALLGEAGRVVPPGDSTALASACIELLSLNDVQRSHIGNTGRQRIKQNYSLQSVVARYAALYAGALGEPRSSHG